LAYIITHCEKNRFIVGRKTKSRICFSSRKKLGMHYMNTRTDEDSYDTLHLHIRKGLTPSSS